MSDFFQDKQQWLNEIRRAPDQYLIVNLEKIPGVGDKLYAIPALRALRKKYPTKRIVAVVNSFWSTEIFANCPYIDLLVESPYPVQKAPNVEILNMDWGFLEHHQSPHQVLTYLKHTTGDDEKTADLTMEMFQNRNDFEHINKVISQIPNDKPWIAIWPAYTMKSRTVEKDAWVSMVEQLKDKYHVLSFGSAIYDMDIPGTIDLRGKFKINQIPPVLDLCLASVVGNTGSLPINGCSKVQMIFLNCGQFPASFLVPYRNGVLGQACIVVDNACVQKQACLEGHISMIEWSKQFKQHKEEFPTLTDSSLTGLTAWFYHMEPSGIHCQWGCTKEITNWVKTNMRIIVDYIHDQKFPKPVEASVVTPEPEVAQETQPEIVPEVAVTEAPVVEAPKKTRARKKPAEVVAVDDIQAEVPKKKAGRPSKKKIETA